MEKLTKIYTFSGINNNSSSIVSGLQLLAYKQMSFEYTTNCLAIGTSTSRFLFLLNSLIANLNSCVFLALISFSDLWYQNFAATSPLDQNESIQNTPNGLSGLVVFRNLRAASPFLKCTACRRRGKSKQQDS